MIKTLQAKKRRDGIHKKDGTNNGGSSSYHWSCGNSKLGTFFSYKLCNLEIIYIHDNSSTISKAQVFQCSNAYLLDNNSTEYGILYRNYYPPIQ